MAIYDIFNVETNAKSEKRSEQATVDPSRPPEVAPAPSSNSLFSAIAARLFFFLLLLADVLWMCYALLLLLVTVVGALLTMFRVKGFIEMRANAVLTIKRSLICGVSLFIALFSPAFGIMIACTYFLMYDRVGIEEIVPASLQSQFKEFLHK